MTAEILQSEMESRGYVCIRNVLPKAELTGLLAQITDILEREGWLLPGYDPLDRVANLAAACGDPDPGFKRAYQTVFNLAAFHALPHHPSLQRIMKMLVGEEFLIHPKPIGRMIFPNCERLRVHAHQDYRFMGGDPECFTVWIPLHDCPFNVGPLQIMEGSHRFGFQEHEDKNLHVPEIRVGSEVGGAWVGGEIDAGDVLIFHSLTVHAAAANSSKRMRISMDCRFQDCARAVNPANLAFAGESGKSWERTYSGWQSHELKYYWKKLPLNLQPSRSDLAQLCVNAATPSLRARYSRILRQIA